MASPKWKIKGIGGKLSFGKAALIVLNDRIANLIKFINKFLRNESAENLHNVRISVRRLRYNMELFYALFEKKKFLRLYNMIENLQDKSGSVRDIYILRQNILLFGKEDNYIIPVGLDARINEKENLLLVDLRTELYRFLHSIELKDILKLIKKKEVL
jgi:hypothetical protein